MDRGMGCWKCQKACFVLQDEGILFMEIPTPYDAVVTAWDCVDISFGKHNNDFIIHLWVEYSCFGIV